MPENQGTGARLIVFLSQNRLYVSYFKKTALRERLVALIARESALSYNVCASQDDKYYYK